MAKYSNYYLDLKEMKDIDNKISDRIFMMYENLISHNSIFDADSLFQTLNRSGYLKDVRDEKIKEVLGG